jgi:3-deoxy-D-manno-octulosonate 8-phosphate phosphatase (KDO 8-P phosphatase)
MQSNYKVLHGKIKCFVFDVDGVLTNGSLILVAGGEQARIMNIRDGYAIQHAIKKGFEVFILSGGKSEEVRTRLKGLGVKNILLGCDDKLSALIDFISETGLTKEQILYMGDDIPDLTAMKICGIACCPSDAAVEIKKICHYISPLKGGEGCVRDIIEQIMKVQGNWI